jgi:hypothetical protein
MKKKSHKITFFLLLALVMTACSDDISQTIEVKRSTPKVVEISQIIPTNTNPLVISQVTITAKPKIIIPTMRSTQPYQDIGYYDGIITLTKYYTLLDHGFYEEAYQFYSSSKQHDSLEKFVENAKRWFVKVDIITIQPLYVNAAKYGGYPGQDSENRKRFYVQIIAWGEGRMTGSRVSGELQTLFIALVKENGEWKINAFGTAPFP